jgi:hypothetical protein
LTDSDEAAGIDERLSGAWDKAIVNLALFGFLNPRIFLAPWFEHNGILGPEEVKGLETAQMTSTLVNIKADWFDLEVSLNRFLIFGADLNSNRMKSLTTSIFNVLAHTPIVGIGVAYETVFAYANREEKQQVMDHLAPLVQWGSIVGENASRTVNIAMPIEDEGYQMRVDIGESNEEAQLLVSVATEWFDPGEDPLGGDPLVEGCDGALRALDRIWPTARQNAQRVFRSVAEIVE